MLDKTSVHKGVTSEAVTSYLKRQGCSERLIPVHSLACVAGVGRGVGIRISPARSRSEYARLLGAILGRSAVAARGEVVTSCGKLMRSRGGVAMARGGVAMARGDVAMARGGVAMARGGVVIVRGGVVLERGGVATSRVAKDRGEGRSAMLMFEKAGN